MQTHTPKLTLLLRRAALLVPLLCLSLWAQAQVIAGSLSYQTGGAGDLEVRFTVRRTFATQGAIPQVGTVNVGGSLDFGDGTTGPLTYTVVANSSTNFTSEGVVTHTYATAGTYTAKIVDCCLPENLLNNAKQPVLLQTVVAAGSANDSPVASVPPIVVLNAGQVVRTYQVNATDPNGDPLTYSLATAADVGSSSFTNVPGLSVNASTGLVSLNTAGLSLPAANLGVALFNPVIKVSDGQTSVLVSHLLRVELPSTNTAPVFTAPTPPAGQRISVYAGNRQTFTVRATDADAGDVVTLRATGLPAGATLTPGLPTSGNPVETTFSWTPPGNTPDAVFPLTFTAEDSRGAQTTISYSIELHGGAPPQFVAPTPANGQVFTAVPGQLVQFTVKATDISGLFGTLLRLTATTALPPGATLTLGTDNGSVIEAAFSWTPTAADAGKTYNVGFQALDREGAQANTAVTIKVVAAPGCDATATAPVANPDQFAACGPVTIRAAQLLANDTDPQGRPLQVSSLGAPSNGTLVTNPDGSFTYTLGAGASSAFIPYVVQVAGPGLASPATGHYYEFVAAPNICWADAQKAAAARTYQGMSGYLATVTTRAETAFLARHGPGKYWFGAADDAVEGEWRWKTGPEAGQLFWRGNATGTAVGYANWSPGEPNDYKNEFRPAGEDYAQLYGESGLWNDVAACGEGSEVAGYIVEYGGLEACTPVLFATGTIMINRTNPAPALVANPDFFTYSRGPKEQLLITAARLLANDTNPQGLPLQVRDISKPSVGQFYVIQTGPDAFTYSYSPPSDFVGKATFTYLLQPAGAVLASPATGHYYEFVAAPGICWADAQKVAAARTYNGMSGYLATVTSAAETEFLKRFSGKSWFGAADDAVEGEWRWKTGPEAGQLFWRGAADGTAVAYANWSPGEPNDYKNEFRPGGEDYAMLYGGSGLWNDLANCGEGGAVDGYVVEYGGLEACTPVLYSVGTVTVDVSPPLTGQAAAAAAAAKAGGAAPATPAVLEAAPNPSGGQFRVRVTAAADGPAQLDLFDMQGRRVRSLYTGSLQAGQVREWAVDAPDLATGVYLVRLQSGAKVQHLRVLIQK